jgi:CRP-like cAMP-binding protein
MDSSWVEQLAKVPVFAGLKPFGLELVAGAATEEIHERDATIFEHGDAGEKLYIILEGRVRIARQVAGMGEEALAILEAGTIFGEMALLDDTPRSADARAHERCRLLAIGREAFEDLLFMHKDLAYEVLWNIIRLLSQRLRDTNDKLAMLTFSAKF